MQSITCKELILLLLAIENNPLKCDGFKGFSHFKNKIMIQEKEIWKEITDYPNYMVSNLGNVKSLERMVYAGNNSFQLRKEIILKPKLFGKEKYYSVNLSNDIGRKSFRIHQLVAIAFLNHIPCGQKLVVNHIDGNRYNNNLKNLEIVSQRENCSKRKYYYTSKYVGVHWDNQNKRWCSSIRINGIKKRLGSFKNEIDAHNAYQKELLKLNTMQNV
jgi:hypothetical protein